MNSAEIILNINFRLGLCIPKAPRTQKLKIAKTKSVRAHPAASYKIHLKDLV